MFGLCRIISPPRGNPSLAYSDHISRSPKPYGREWPFRLQRRLPPNASSPAKYLRSLQSNNTISRMAPLEILIVGCGIAGSTLASFLLLSDNMPASEKPRITILERSPAQRSQGQNIDIRGAGITIIRKLGLETAIRASTTGEVGVKWVDEHNQVWAALGADRTGELSTPTADIEILRGRLAELCWLRSESISEQVKADGGAGIDFIWGDYLSEVDQDGSKVHVKFAKSGQRRSYDLVVDADGLQSGLRKLVWGQDSDRDHLKSLDTHAWFFSMPKGPTDTDWRRWFHAPGRRNVMLRPAQQKDRTTVFAFVVNDKDPRLIDAAGKGRDALDEQKGLFEEYFQDVGWESKRLLTEMRKTSDFYYDMIGQVQMNSWSKGRVVLLGDAGYVIHLHSSTHTCFTCTPLLAWSSPTASSPLTTHSSLVQLLCVLHLLCASSPCCLSFTSCASPSSCASSAFYPSFHCCPSFHLRV